MHLLKDVKEQSDTFCYHSLFLQKYPVTGSRGKRSFVHSCLSPGIPGSVNGLEFMFMYLKVEQVGKVEYFEGGVSCMTETRGE